MTKNIEKRHIFPKKTQKWQFFIVYKYVIFHNCKVLEKFENEP